MAGQNQVRKVVIIFLAAIAFIPMYALVSGCLQPAQARAYNRASDLSEIGKALFAYENVYGEWLPPNLWSLYPRFIDDPSVLANAPPRVETGRNDVFFGRLHYPYQGGASPRDHYNSSEHNPIVYFPTRDDNGEHCLVLSADGRVKYEDDMLSVWRPSKDE